ncbi:methyltransferase family protein [Tumebacillus sp. BK434]|uniref:class I SAM-dependent methyltransferase n=1 Tax=Tumebacillus sp. BK434 TaxID=2512169 RepID=UPI00104FF1C5|nr:class I SAM-dependent methyltransferase [Tumebacillus sp. BK434]TCP58984.1 methyltransferase family protein [Tumebacillus sp. BK434]
MNNQHHANEAKALVQSQFGKNAQHYVNSELHAKGDDLALLVEWLQPEKSAKALDIATGGGHVSKALSPHVGAVVACDLTREMLHAASGHLQAAGCDNVLFVRGDAEDLPFLNEAFDIVTCRIAPHHFPHPQSFVQEVARVLRTGGQFLMIDNVVPDGEFGAWRDKIEKLRDPSHVRCLSVEEWKNLFQQAGLTEVHSRLRRKTFLFQPWMERMSCTEEQKLETEALILSGEQEWQEYFNVVIEGGRVVSFEIEEWMVLTKK